jgi:hypothetical protein
MPPQNAARAPSTELTGGTGFTFEGTAAATFLVSLLIEGSARGLFGYICTRVAFQQANFGEPLDDVIVDATAPDGSSARLSLQIKRSLRISRAESNTDFREIVINSWKTLEKPDFRDGVDRVGAGTGDITSASYRNVNTLHEIARGTADENSFADRFLPNSGTGDPLRNAFSAFKTILSDHLRRPPTNAEIHRLLRHFVLLQYDLLHEAASDESDAIDRLRPILKPEEASRSGALWTRLKTIARESAGNAAAFTRQTLVEHLHGDFRLVGSSSHREDIRKLLTSSRLALENIGAQIDGNELPRPALLQKAEEAIQQHRLVQLIGLPGSGKSAILRAIANRLESKGPVIVLKSDRLAQNSWPAYATSIGLSCTSPDELLLDLASQGWPTLIIDGLDRIEVPDRGIIIDLLNAILNNPALDRWRIIASLRDNGTEPLQTWLPPAILVEDGVSTVEVKSFDDSEATTLADLVPRLRPLLFSRDERVREIARRPFFANVLARTFNADENTPTSEIDLVDAWWRRGGYNAQGAATTRRQKALRSLARSGASTMGRRMSVAELDDDILEALKNDGIIDSIGAGHTVKFTHDIFFEWSFLHLLISREDEWLSEIRVAGEPPVLGRVVELLSLSVFIADLNWESHLARIESASMRPQWARAWLIGPFTSPAFPDHAAPLIDILFKEDGRRVAKLLVWFQAEKTRANPNILSQANSTGRKTPTDIARLADLLAWPSDIPLWVRFCNWLLDNIDRFPPRLIPDVVSVFEVWQNMLSATPNALSDRIITVASTWLQQIQNRENRRPRRYGETPPDFWSPLSRDMLSGLQTTLRILVLRASSMYPDLVTAYLSRIQANPDLRSSAFKEIMNFAPMLAKSHAAQLADFTLAELLEELPLEVQQRNADNPYFPDSYSFHANDSLSINREHNTFHPSSPLREPFHSLFKEAPTEALRLVRGICNHAMTAWRQLFELDPRRRDIPIPVHLSFPWGCQNFWGTASVYVWSRAINGPPAIECALMALENWAFSQVEGSRDIDAIIQDVVSANECCAVLGIAAALAIANDHVSPVTLPLVCSQRLWTWDIQRLSQDVRRSHLNLIGFGLNITDEAHLEAVRQLNSRPVRRSDIRNLVMLFTVSANDSLASSCRTAVLAFPDTLPVEFESEKQDQDHLQNLRRTAQIWSEFGRPENYRQYRAPDSESVYIAMQNPRSGDPDVVAAAQNLEEMNADSALWLWVDDSFSSRTVSAKMSLGDALSRAQAIDTQDLFSSRATSDVSSDLKLVGVAGTAAVMLAFGGTLDEVQLSWAQDVINRAAGSPERPDPLWNPGAHLPFHPCIMAVRGYAALIRRDPDDRTAKESILCLAAHPLEQVSAEAITAALELFTVDPDFAFIALDLGLRLSIANRNIPVTAFGYDPRADLQRRIDAVETAVRNLHSDRPFLTLAKLPAPWVFAPLTDPRRRTRSGEEPVWRESDELWLWHYPPLFIPKIPNREILADDVRRPVFLKMCSDFLGWTIESLQPSWESENDRGRNHRSTDHGKWRSTLFTFLGQVAAFIDPAEANSLFLQPIASLTDEELSTSCLEPFIDTYVSVAILDSPQIPNGAIAFLENCVDQILCNNALVCSSDREGRLYGFHLPYIIETLFFIRHEAGGAARFANGNWTDVGTIIPVVERLMADAGLIPKVMLHFLTLCEKAMPHYPVDRFVRVILQTLSNIQTTPPGWHGTFLPARIASLIHEFGTRTQPLPHALAQHMLRILDLLVDMGDRRAAALQTSEIFKDVRLLT